MRPVVLAALIAAAALPAWAQGEMKEVESPGAAKHQDRAYRTDTVEVPLKAAGETGNEVEYMVQMKAGDSLVYSLESPAGSDVWHEFHGHTPTAVTFYKKADGVAHHGSLTAPFDGSHGWYLENRSKTPVTVRLTLTGFYEPES